MSSPAETRDSTTGAAVGVGVVGVMILGVVYVITVFVSGSVGIVKQLANPAEHHEFNATILAWAAVPLATLAYLVIPEFGRNLRLSAIVAGGSALAGTIAFILAAVFLTPIIERTSSLESLAGGVLLFIVFGTMPTYAVARLLVSQNADVRVAGQGDHFIETDKLSPETTRIVQKHCGAGMHCPQGWRPLTIWGYGWRLTYSELEKILALEEAEEKRLTELYRLRTPNEERRTAEEAFKELAAHKANTAREIAALRSEAERLRQAVAEAGAKDRATLAAVREEKRQVTRELLRAHADLEDAQATSERLGNALREKDAAVRRATAALDETKAAALREISVAKEERRGEAALFAATIRRLRTAVADSERERAVAEARCEALRREAAETAQLVAAEYAAQGRTQAAQQREIAHLKAKLAEHARATDERTVKPAAPAKTAAVAPAPTPKDARPHPRLTLVVDNPWAPALFSKSPERRGMPRRLWRRTQRSLRKGGIE